jgi:hypothetical protein
MRFFTCFKLMIAPCSFIINLKDIWNMDSDLKVNLKNFFFKYLNNRNIMRF